MLLIVASLLLVARPVKGFVTPKPFVKTRKCGIDVTWSAQGFQNTLYQLNRQNAPFGARKAIAGMEFQGLGYVHLRSTFNFVADMFNISLSFQTFDADALLLYLGGHFQGDFVSIQLQNGHVALYVHNGIGTPTDKPAKATDITQKYNDGRLHTVTAWKVGAKEAFLLVDGRGPFNGSFQGGFLLLQGTTGLYLGGIPPGVTVDAPTVTKPFSGCLLDVYLDGKSLEELEKTVFVDSKNTMNRTLGCLAFVEQGAYFKGAGYAKLNVSSLFSMPQQPEIQVKFSFRTPRTRGLLVAVQGRTQADAIAVYMVNGVVRLAAVTPSNSTATANSGVIVCDGHWHDVGITIGKTKTSIQVDDAEVQTLETTAGQEISELFLGGASPRTNLTALFDEFSTPFGGCIRRLAIGNESTDVSRVAESFLHVSLAGCPYNVENSSNSSSAGCADSSANRQVYKGVLPNFTDVAVDPFTEYFYRLTTFVDWHATESLWIALFSAPTAPLGLMRLHVEYDSQGSATLSWTSPQYPNGLFDRFLYQVVVYTSYPQSQLSSSDRYPSIVDGKLSYHYNLDVTVSTKYSFSVIINAPEGSVESSRISVQTPETFSDSDCYREYDRGLSYRGRQNVTANGTACFSWKARRSFIEKAPNSGIGNHNYCRNPSPENRTRPWCFVGLTLTEWDYCQISPCKDYKCYSVKDQGRAYQGARNYTNSGAACLNWATVPYSSNFSLSQENHSFCRNLLNKSRPWCFVNNTQWEDCDIPICKDFPAVPYTCNGTSSGHSCIFPFTFNNYEFYECTDYNSSLPWCATSVDAWGNVKEWGYCRCPAFVTATSMQSTSTPGTVFQTIQTTNVLSTTESFTKLPSSATVVSSSSTGAMTSDSFGIGIIVAAALCGLTVGILSTVLLAYYVKNRCRSMTVAQEDDDNVAPHAVTSNPYAEVDLSSEKIDSMKMNPLYARRNRKERFPGATEDAKTRPLTSRLSENPLYELTSGEKNLD
eukprot:m.69812 g.69812  ORF g.69812 m.69812 type:complete len:990 (+) comp35634_c0_seq2:109-3078(+)